LRLNLRWNNGEVELQDPATGEILLDRRGVRLAMEEAQQARFAARRAQESAERVRDDTLRENQEYRDMVRRLREQLRQQGEEPQ
jgi:hypothetical protein